MSLCADCERAECELIQPRMQLVPVHVCADCAAAYRPRSERIDPSYVRIDDIVARLRELEVEMHSESRREPMMHRNAAGVAAAIRIVEGFR